jgi:hypothetical protein
MAPIIGKAFHIAYLPRKLIASIQAGAEFSRGLPSASSWERLTAEVADYIQTHLDPVTALPSSSGGHPPVGAGYDRRRGDDDDEPHDGRFPRGRPQPRKCCR